MARYVLYRYRLRPHLSTTPLIRSAQRVSCSARLTAAAATKPLKLRVMEQIKMIETVAYAKISTMSARLAMHAAFTHSTQFRQFMFRKRWFSEHYKKSCSKLFAP